MGAIDDAEESVVSHDAEPRHIGAVHQIEGFAVSHRFRYRHRSRLEARQLRQARHVGVTVEYRRELRERENAPPERGVEVVRVHGPDQAPLLVVDDDVLEEAELAELVEVRPQDIFFVIVPLVDLKLERLNPALAGMASLEPLSALLISWTEIRDSRVATGCRAAALMVRPSAPSESSPSLFVTTSQMRIGARSRTRSVRVT